MALVKLSTKLVGSTVKLNENSSPVEFVVAQQGSPSSAYVGFDGGTTLVRKGAHSSRIWGANIEGGYNYPDDCEIHTWLNNTYLNTLDSDIRAAVKQVKIPYVSEVDYSGAGNLNQGTSGMSCKVFLLSLAEVGFSATSGYSGVPDEGTVLSWFASSGDDARNLNGNDWWLRTPAPASSGQYAYYCTDGVPYPWMSQGYNAGNTTQSKYVRPVLVLDAELYVDDDGNVITNQPPSAPSSIAASNVIGNQNATVTLGAATDEDGTIANYIYERQVDGGSWTQFASTSSLTTTDSINDSWTTVTYRAKAVDNLGAEGPYATSQAYTVVHNQPPTAPGSINATNVVGGQDATITITAATDPDGTVESYMYERSVDDSSHWDVIATTSALSTTDTISSDWGTVTYRAKAVDDDGASGPYVTSEQYDVNVGWVLIGGPSTAMGQQIKPFTLSAPDVYYCTDGSTYYTGGTLLLLAIGNVGDIMTFAGQQWIISHKTASEAYLTLNGLSGNSTWYDLQQKCTNFANSLNEAQKNCLKSVTAGNTSGKVFVATKDQMNGGFSYFNSNSRRSVGSVYWTSTRYSSDRAWFVDSGGRLYGDGGYDYYKSNSLGFRPSICIDLTKL